MEETNDTGITPGTEPTPTTERPKQKPKPRPAKVQPKREGPGHPGRPPGARNKPKAPGMEPIPKMRKSPEEYSDTKSALDTVAKQGRALCERHNKAHPGDKWEVIVRPAGELAPKLSPEMCATLFGKGADILGSTMAVDSRPTPDATIEVGKAWSAASAYLPEFDPKWMALGLAVAATLGAVAPMFAESKARKMGIIAPGTHIGPHELANRAKGIADQPAGDGV